MCDLHTGDGKLVVVIGDSHAWHWRVGLERVARSRDWRLLFITKSACAVADIQTRYKSCPGWREAAFERSGPSHPRWSSCRSSATIASPVPTVKADSTRLWRKGLVRSLRRLDRMVEEVILLGDISRFGADPWDAFGDTVPTCRSAASDGQWQRTATGSRPIEPRHERPVWSTARHGA